MHVKQPLKSDPYSNRILRLGNTGLNYCLQTDATVISMMNLAAAILNGCARKSFECVLSIISRAWRLSYPVLDSPWETPTLNHTQNP